MEVLYTETGDPKYRPCTLLKKMVRAGKLGQKLNKDSTATTSEITKVKHSLFHFYLNIEENNHGKRIIRKTRSRFNYHN